MGGLEGGRLLGDGSLHVCCCDMVGAVDVVDADVEIWRSLRSLMGEVGIVLSDRCVRTLMPKQSLYH